jgi:hypothetical protein
MTVTQLIRELEQFHPDADVSLALKRPNENGVAGPVSHLTTLLYRTVGKGFAARRIPITSDAEVAVIIVVAIIPQFLRP